jgi:hypothetical protein
LDFDVARSVVKAGNSVIIHLVINVSTEATLGNKRVLKSVLKGSSEVVVLFGTGVISTHQ